jgi:hypothetical protein
MAYWPLDEGSGSVARCLVNPAQSGTAVGVTWANDSTNGITGTPAPYFDGANDYVDVHTTALAAAFNGSEGSICLWYLHDPLSHNDATLRRLLRLTVDGTNYILIAKTGTNSNVQTDYVADGVGEISGLALNPLPTDWKHFGLTWSKANDRVRYYNEGVNYETDNGLGNWAGNPAAAVVGASNTVPTNPYYGWIQHPAIWDRELIPGEMATLAGV